MLKLPLSVVKALPFDFEQAVKDHIQALEDHRFTVGVAAPMEKHPYVAAAVKRVQYPIDAKKPDDFVPAYEIVDDTPVLSLEDKKNKLEHELRVTVGPLMLQASGPQRRQMLASLKTGEAYAVPPDDRTAEHNALIAEHEARQVRLNVLHRYMAEQMVEIEDLDETTIDAWKQAPLP